MLYLYQNLMIVMGVEKLFYKLIIDTLTSGKITVSSQIDIFNTITTGERFQLNAGYKSQAVRLNFENGLGPNVLKISSNVLKALSIPTNIPYQLIFSGKDLRLGPVIGLLMYKKRSAMTKESLRKHLNYTLLYKNMGGLIYTFSIKDISFDTHSVEGFYYNPLKDKWEKGIFPFPDAIYRRVSLSYKTMQRLKYYTSNRIFNSAYFSKLDYWNMASSSKSIAGHIPMTRKYSSFSDIDLMLENFTTLFLKPIDGMRALGLVKITKDKGQYSFQGKLDDRPILISSRADAVKHFNEIKKKRTYIIQQSVDLLNFEDRYTDFRVIMQKDHTMDWQCTGIITSIGKQGGICSNYNEDDRYMQFEKFFEKYLKLDKKEIFLKKNEVIDVCKKACKVLDESGINCIDLGVDIGLDQKLKPWIFELNNRFHCHYMTLYIKDYDMFFRVKANPIRYIVKLCGFEVE